MMIVEFETEHGIEEVIIPSMLHHRIKCYMNDNNIESEEKAVIRLLELGILFHIGKGK